MFNSIQMKRSLKFFLPLLSMVAISTSVPQVSAQDGDGSESGGTGQAEAGIAGYWEIILPGGKFMTPLNMVTSISQHEYVVDGSARVYEVTVDTAGSVVARFYYIEAVAESSMPLGVGQSAVERVREITKGATDRTDTSDLVWRTVVKNYPTTTHAKTTEFRLTTKENLDQIYAHIHKAWAEKETRKSFLLRIKDE